jgi:hypothetical protein
VCLLVQAGRVGESTGVQEGGYMMLCKLIYQELIMYVLRRRHHHHHHHHHHITISSVRPMEAVKDIIKENALIVSDVFSASFLLRLTF